MTALFSSFLFGSSEEPKPEKPVEKSVSSLVFESNELTTKEKEQIAMISMFFLFKKKRFLKQGIEKKNVLTFFRTTFRFLYEYYKEKPSR